MSPRRAPSQLRNSGPRVVADPITIGPGPTVRRADPQYPPDMDRLPFPQTRWPRGTIPRMRSPILLNSSVSLPPGATREPEVQALRNPFKVPMLVEEIRFGLMNGIKADSTGWASGWTGMLPIQIQVELTLGRAPLTKHFVPVGVLGKRLIGASLPILLSSAETIPDTAVMTNNVIVWKLPKPLYVPPSELLAPKFLYNASSGSTQTIYIQYACRTLSKDDPVPKKIYVPWASAYITPPSADGILISDSTEADIVNATDQMLNVERFVGYSASYGAFVEVDPPPTDIIPRLYQMIQAVDSFGNVLVRDPTPFATVFNSMDYSWTVNTKLQPKGFYLFHIEQDVPASIAAATRVAIGMVGHRIMDL